MVFFGKSTGNIINLVIDSSVKMEYITDGSGNIVNSFGGILGYMTSGLISNCVNNADIRQGAYAGGIVGEINNGTVLKSYNTGNITGTIHAGGVIGYVINSANVQNVYNTGNIINVSSNSSGILGYANISSSIVNAYSTAQSVSTAGIIKSTIATMKNLYFIKNGNLPINGISSGNTPDRTVNGGWSIVFDNFNKSTEGIGIWAQLPDGRPVIKGLGDGAGY